MVLLVGVLGSSSAQAQVPDGSWGPVLNWERYIAERDFVGDPTGATLLCPEDDTNSQVGQGNKELEISHMALIPTGTYAGWVLMWRKELETDPSEPDFCSCTQETSVLWAVNPASPGTAIAIYWDFDSDIFCAGQSWDRLGQLVIVGGVPSLCEGQLASGNFPGETYRFRPKSLGTPEYPDVPFNSPSGAFEGAPYFALIRDPVRKEGNMVLGRYYPTVLPLQQRTAEFSPGLLVDGVVTPGQTIGPGVNMVLGGPPQFFDSLGGPRAEGNEIWEVIETSATVPQFWRFPFLPVNPSQVDPDWGTITQFTPFSTNGGWERNAPHLVDSPSSFDTGNGFTYDPYVRKFVSGETPPDRLLDSYPRIFQLTNGELLVCGDVDTVTSPGYGVGQAGATWNIRPDYQGGLLTEWESWKGPIGAEQPGVGVWHDSFYDSAVLLQIVDTETGNRDYRVLMFGGSRDMNGPATGQPPTSGVTPDWQANTEMWEFNPDTSPMAADPVRDGTWEKKGEDVAFERVFAQGVVMPTGQIFIVGGTKTDDAAGQAGHDNGVTDPAAPIIYDPGAGQLDPGMIYTQPNTVAGTGAPVLPRLYHSVAALLPDGRVMIAGGKRAYLTKGVLDPAAGTQLGDEDPRYSGQIFSPPYLDFANNGFIARPLIDSVEAPISFNDPDGTFEVVVIRALDTTHSIDRVVLMRPAATTHHFDNDQRYVELDFFVSDTSSSGTETTDTLTVGIPGDDEVPPGYYMLFVIEQDATPTVLGHRVPSVGQFVQLK